MGGSPSSTITPSCGSTSTAAVTTPGYIAVNVVSGTQYTFATCGTSPSFDSQITVFNSASTVSSIAYNDDGCSPLSTVSYTATFTGTVYVQVNTYNCSTTANPATVSVSCIVPPPPAQGTDCTSADLNQLCGSTSFSGSTSTVDGTFVTSSGCLSSTPRESWFMLNVTTAGPLDLDVLNSGGLDVDAALYGPFTASSAALTSCTAAAVGTPVACDYSSTNGTSADPALYINSSSGTPCTGATTTSNCLYNASVGIYLLLITNFSSTSAIISIGGSSVSASPGSNATVSCANPLNVAMSTFTGKLNRELNAELKWVTATEINNKKFIVERSRENDGFAFEPIGEVYSASINGNSQTALTYTFVDKNPRIGDNFYRLRQIDLDDNPSFTEVVKISKHRTNLKDDIFIQPNPTTNNIQYSLEAAESGAAQINVLDIVGKTVLSKNQELSEGENTFSLEVQHLAKGPYILQIIDASGNLKSQRFVKE
ncbi:MAG: T9SS type A sorting domain-containing protein [Saprospiraceae bacterium]|nr:T9SS type A sorting domain-containing protein [Saprospiraceae bacterium]